MESSNTYRQILLIGKDQKQSIPELIFVQHSLQFFTSLYNSLAIVAINNENNALGILEIVPPKRPNLVLSTNVPYGELDIFVFNGLNVETYSRQTKLMLCIKLNMCLLTNCWNGGYDFPEFEFVENSSLPCSIKTHHQDSHLLLAP